MNPITRFLCLLGLHRWTTTATPNFRFLRIERQCRRCGVVHQYEGKGAWSHKL